MTGPDLEPHLDECTRVAIFSPFRDNTAVIATMVQEIGLFPVECRVDADVLDRLMNGCGALILGQEGLRAGMLGSLGEWFRSQPAWSELPVIAVLDARGGGPNALDHLRSYLPSAKLVVLQRPLRRVELATAIQTAVQARRRQLELRDHLAWQTEVQRELTHRVKNILASVMAVFHMSFREAKTLDVFAKGFEGRLGALSKVHSAVLSSEQGEDLGQLSSLILAPYHSPSAPRVSIEGPDVLLAPTAVIPLAMCLHELATNAAKYGSLSSDGGRIMWSWSLDDRQDVLRLVWREEGGPPVAQPKSEGYGTKFLRSAVRGLRGGVEPRYEPTGLVAEITLARKRALIEEPGTIV